LYDDISTLSLPPSRTAFFLDFDGTLAEIVDDPLAVSIGDDVLEALARLSAASDGALAVVSGREIATLDGFLSPLRLPLGGAHGTERRDARGKIHRVEVDDRAIDRLAMELDRFAAVENGLLVERKRTSVALHYRRRPDLEERCRHLARSLVSQADGIAVLEGKMVVELKLSGRTKGDLIADFMAEEPFRGRRPVFFGDDVTDEDGFASLPRWSGISVKVGEGATAAAFRIRDPAALHAWLKRLAGSAGEPAGTGPVGTERGASS
jgi:trehalose 6-phosphate phosphatase